MGWNHRILAHKDGDDWYFQIHEVYYNKQNEPEGYTENGTPVGAENIESIHWVLDKMKECINKPVLSVDNFPNEWSPNK